MSLLILDTERPELGFQLLTPEQAGELAKLLAAGKRLADRRGAPFALEEARDRAFEAYARGESAEGDSSTTTLADRKRDTPRPDSYLGSGDELLTQRAVANTLEVSPRTVQRMLDRGDLAPTRSGAVRRICRSELDRYLTAREEAAE